MSETRIGPVLDRRHVIVGSAAVLMLSACGSLLSPSNPPNAIYVLTPNLSSSSAVMPGWQISVAVPEASATLATTRIALLRGQTMDYYANAQWTDAAPQLFQSLLIAALEKGGAIGAVARKSVGIRAEYTLLSEIESFEAHYDNGDAAPNIVVEITVKLVTGSHGDIIGAHTFRQEARASANSVPAVVSAFDGAVSVILADIVHWVLETAPAHAATKGR